MNDIGFRQEGDENVLSVTMSGSGSNTVNYGTYELGEQYKQIGDRNKMTVTTGGGEGHISTGRRAHSELSQLGDDNIINVSQPGWATQLKLTQDGNENEADITQDVFAAKIEGAQKGDQNKLEINQAFGDTTYVSMETKKSIDLSVII